MADTYLLSAEISSLISQENDEGRRIRIKTFKRYADMADAMYGKDSDKKALIRGNKNTFSVLANKDLVKITLMTTMYNKPPELINILRNRPELKTFLSKGMNELIVDLAQLKGECNLDDVILSKDAFLAALKVFNQDSKDETQSTKAEIDQRKIADIDRRIEEAEEDLRIGMASGDLDEATCRAIEGMILELKNSKAEVLAGIHLKEEEMFSPEAKLAAEILAKEANANFQFTDKEIKALKLAFKSVGYSIKGGEGKELKEDNFVAVSRNEFSAVFIFHTLMLDIGKRRKVANAFISATGYQQFGDIDETPYGRQDWWAISVITDNKKFNSTEWLGSLLYDYKHLGNPRKMWVGASLQKEQFTIDFMDPQNSFTLIGGKSRSGKTCISHSMLIQAIVGGVVPTFLDWKPEGSELYKSLGFYAVQRNAMSWLNAAKDEGKHLLDLINGLAWLQSVVTVTEKREIAGFRDFDKNGMATVENPSMLFVFDELAAFIGDLSSIRVKKPEKEMTAKDKAANEVAKLAESVFKQLNACLRKCATYGIRFMAITQDIMISDTIWSDKAWGGEEGKAFRKAMQNIFWGRGTVRGSDCPISDKQQRTFVNMGLGRFGLEVNGNAETIRGLRIDNTPSDKLPGMDAGSILQGCLKKVGAELNPYRSNLFEEVNREIMSSDAFSSVVAKVKEAYLGEGYEEGGGTEADEFINEDIESLLGQTIDTARDTTRNNLDTPSKKVELQKPNAHTFRIEEDATLMAEMFGGQETTKEVETPKEEKSIADMLRDAPDIGDNDFDDDIEDFEGPIDFGTPETGERVEPRPVCINSDRIATTTADKEGKDVRVDLDALKNISATYLNRDNSIDCTRCHSGAKNWRDMILLKTPRGQDKMSTLLWKDILDTIESSGFKGAVVTRLSIYGDKMYINGKIVNLNGVIGGHHNIRLQDIIQIGYTFKRFRYLRELRVDMDIMDSIQLELGNNAIEEIFKRETSLLYLYIASKDTYQRYTRQDIEDMKNNARMAKLEERMQERRERMQFDAECKARNVDQRGKRGIGYDLSMNKYAKSSFGNAGQHLFKASKPSLVKGLAWGGLGIVTGAASIVGGLLGGGVRAIRDLTNLK